MPRLFILTLSLLPWIPGIHCYCVHLNREVRQKRLSSCFLLHIIGKNKDNLCLCRLFLTSLLCFQQILLLKCMILLRLCFSLQFYDFSVINRLFKTDQKVVKSLQGAGEGFCVFANLPIVCTVCPLANSMFDVYFVRPSKACVL